MRKTIAGVALAAAATIPACGEDSGGCMLFGPWGEMPDLVMMAGDTVETSLADHFSPRDCFDLFLADYGDRLFEARSSDPAAVAVSASGAVLTMIAIDAADSVLVNVGPELLADHRRDGCIRRPGSRCRSDPGYFHNFYVSVTGPPR